VDASADGVPTVPAELAEHGYRDDGLKAPPGRVAGGRESFARWRSDREQQRALKQLLATLTILAAALISYNLLNGKNAPSAGSVRPDATVLISTLIAIDIALITVYGVLLPLLNARTRDQRGPWEWAAIVLMVVAVLVDLWRIENSVGDMYAATIGRLTLAKTYDAEYEFLHYYFFSNVAVLLVALWAITRRGPHAPGLAGADQPR
jgi:hypothetical protein